MTLGINLNIASKKEHVPEIEWSNRVVKERVRSSRATMSFQRIYKLMIIHIFATEIFWVNYFLPPHAGAGI